MSDSELFQHDWYAILGCEFGASKDIIEKAARKMSRQYHPDKNSSKDAPEKFLLVTKAKETLLDDSKRKEIDEKIKAKATRKAHEEERNSHMDTKRKKMREDLEKSLSKYGTQERPHATVPTPTSKFQSSTRHNKFENIKKDGAEKMEAWAEVEREREFQRTEEFLRQRSSMVDETKFKGLHQVKIKWKRSRQSHSEESIHQLLKEYGSIEEIVFVGDKGNAALVSFTEADAARNAVREFEVSEDYKISFLKSDTDVPKKKAAVFGYIYKSGKSNDARDPSFHTIFNANVEGTGMIDGSMKMGATAGSQESDLRREARRAKERAELLRAMYEEENGISEPAKKSDIQDKVDYGAKGGFTSRTFARNFDSVDSSTKFESFASFDGLNSTESANTLHNTSARTGTSRVNAAYNTEAPADHKDVNEEIGRSDAFGSSWADPYYAATSMSFNQLQGKESALMDRILAFVRIPSREAD